MSENSWTEYKSRYGTTLFFYNKETGEHKWPMDDDNKLLQDNIIHGQPIPFKEQCSIATQTDDYGCDNGCSSIYINAGQGPDTLNDLQLSDAALGSSSEMSTNIQIKQEPMDNLEGISIQGVLNDLQLNPEDSTNYSLTNQDGISLLNDLAVKPTKNSTRKVSDKPFKCSQCNHQFYLEQDLTHHKRIHSAKTSFECSYCKKLFYRKGHYNSHLRMHATEKPFKCSLCDKQYVSRINLKTHELTHTGKKPHKCSVCSRQFRQKGHLTDHIRTHYGVKPYECIYCKKCFGRKSHVRRHMSRVHIEKR